MPPNKCLIITVRTNLADSPASGTYDPSTYGFRARDVFRVITALIDARGFHYATTPALIAYATVLLLTGAPHNKSLPLI
jgi:hypothetical protein